MEIRVRLRCDGFGEERLAGSRGAVQQHAFRRFHAEPLKQFWMTKRQLDHLADLADLASEAADVLVVDLGDLRLFLFHRLLGDLDLRVRLDEDSIRAGSERRDHELKLAAHDAHTDHIAAGDRAPLEDLRHVLLASHDSNRLGRGERHFLGRAGERLAQTDFVVDPDAGVAALHPVHSDHAAIRVLGISTANPRGGRLRAFDEDYVAFLQLEDLHDFGVDAHDPAARIGGLRLGNPEELLTSGGHVQRVSSRAGLRPSRDFATNRRYLNSCRNLETKKRRERSRAASLDGHLDGLRLWGRLLLRNADLEDAVFQRRGGEVGLDLLREAQYALEGLVRPLAVLVVLLLLLTGAVRFRADLDPIRGHGEVDVLLRNAGEFRPDHELGTLVDQVDQGLADAQVGVGPPGGGASPEAVLEAPAYVVEPPVHVVQPGEGRHGRPRQARRSVLSLNLLALSLHGVPPPRRFSRSIMSMRFYINTTIRGPICERLLWTRNAWRPAGGLDLPLDGDRDRATVELDPCDLDRIHDPARHVDEDR